LSARNPEQKASISNSGRYRSPRSGKGCIAAQSICLIDCFGNVKHLFILSAVSGNIRITPFWDIWENSALFNELRDFSSYRANAVDANS
jgi:MoaA/NifB/PqqE/SkfB family radical SAM enzyme